MHAVQAGVAAACEDAKIFSAHRSRPASPGRRRLQQVVSLLFHCRHRSLLRHRFEVAVTRTGVSETSTRFLSLATRLHDEQLPWYHCDWSQRIKRRGEFVCLLSTNQDDVSFVQGCRLRCGTFIGARFHFQLRGCVVSSHHLIIHRHVLPDFG